MRIFYYWMFVFALLFPFLSFSQKVVELEQEKVLLIPGRGSYVRSLKLPMTYIYSGRRIVDSVLQLYPVSCNEMKVQAEKPYTLEYYADGDTTLYGTFSEEGKLEIRGAYIENLDLNRLPFDTVNNKLVIPYAIRLTDCVVDKITLPAGFLFSNSNESSSPEESVEPSKKKVYDTLVFQRDIIITTCLLNGLQFQNMVFNGRFAILNCQLFPYSDLSIQNSVFNKSVYVVNRIFGEFYHPSAGGNRERATAVIDSFATNIYKCYYRTRNSNTTFGFTNCRFQDISFFYHTNRFKTLDLSNSVFHDKVYLNKFNTAANRDYMTRRIRELPALPKGSSGRRRFREERDTSYNVLVDGAKFFRPVYFENTIYKYLELSGTHFSDTLHLAGTQFVETNPYSRQGKGFKLSYFKGDNIISIGNGNIALLDTLNFSSSSLQKIHIPFIFVNNRRKIDSATLEQIQLFYGDIIQLVERKYPKAEADVIKARINHDIKMYELEYYRQNLFHPVSNFFKYIWFSLLEAVVGNGYKGEGKFARTAIVVILLFALVYFLFFRKQVTMYVHDINNSKSSVVMFEANFMSFVKCLWMSFIIFINPRFPFSFFRLKRGLFILFCIEWILGLFIIVLFLVYIAINYPFIKTLIGI